MYLWTNPVTLRAVAFYGSQPAVTGLKPPLSLSPSGRLLMRDAVKRMVTFFLVAETALQSLLLWSRCIGFISHRGESDPVLAIPHDW